jgi:hypothetical protein
MILDASRKPKPRCHSRVSLCVTIVAVGCMHGVLSHRSAHAQSTGAQATKTSPTVQPGLSAAIELTTKWVNALRSGDIPALRDLAAFPFELRDTGAEGDCVSCSLDNQYRLVFMLECLVGDHVLREDLKNNPELRTEVLSRKHFPGLATRWRKELKPGQIPVQLSLFGSGVTFYFIVLASTAGVQGVWKHAVFDQN